jgi:hypothetical protein
VSDFNDTEREVFQHMNTKDQIISLFDMSRYVRGEIAGMRRDLINFLADNKTYRAQREEKEQDTTDKIEAVIGKRFDFAVYLRDKIAPPIVTMIVIALLYLAFQKP